MIRKEFIKWMGLGSILSAYPTFLLSQNIISKKNKMLTQEERNYFEDELADRATVVSPKDGERLKLNGLSVTFKVTSDMSNNQLGVYEIVLPPRTIGAKLHYHRFMDETFMVSQGTLTIEVGSRQQSAQPGTVAYVPRFTPHGFRNDTDEPVKLILIFNPSEQREGFFRGLHETLSEVPINPDKFLKLYHKYDSFPVDVNKMIPTED